MSYHIKHERFTRWVDVPLYVELAEKYYGDEDPPLWIFSALDDLYELEQARWEDRHGLFYCSFCGLWKPAAEVVPGSWQNFFTCADIKHCEAYLAYGTDWESFMQRGWYPASVYPERIAVAKLKRRG